MRNKAGFTLIEIMVSLVLVGLIASVAGTSVLMGLRGYVNTRENNVITQKTQLAMNRINRELIELIDIKHATPTCIIYESPYGKRAIKIVESDNDKTISLFTNVIVSSCDALSSGDILVDGVDTFTIKYNPEVQFGVMVDTWAFNSIEIHDPNSLNHISRLYAMQVKLDLARPDMGGTVPFFTTVSPRNNNNAGGEAVPTPDNMPPDYASKTCFVATAAWGDRDHPMVELLREFRDRVLAKTETGAAFICFYYRFGPTLAAAIEGNALACLAARILITPLAGLAFFTLYVPLLIPLLLILCWGMARLILSRPRGRLFQRPNPRGQRGAILVTLIAAMVVFSALSAVMISMFGSTSLGQAASNSVMRAYYLAESGFRYAASEYINEADETARESKMKAMHNQEYQMAANNGKFRLMVYPYYYRVYEIPTANPQWLNTKVTGGYPLSSGDYVNGSWIRIGSDTYQILGASLIFPDIVQFTKKTGNWSGIAAGAEVMPACVPNSSAGLSLTDHGDITIVKDSGADAFPQRNGTFTVKIQGETKPRIMRYRELDLVSNPPKLKGVYDPNGTTITGKTMMDPGGGFPNNFVLLSKFVKVESTGIFSQGSQEVSRKVTYETPVGYMSLTAPKTEVKEQFGSSLANWYTGSEVSHIGTQQIVDGALKLTSAVTTNVAPASSCLLFQENQIALNWRAAMASSGTQENFETEWRRAGGYLSYDVQTKIRLDSTNQVYAGGLSFRLDETGNSLGFTILRSDTGLEYPSLCDKDGIPESLTQNPNIGGEPYLVLWMKEMARTENITTIASPHMESVNYTDPPPVGTGTRAIVIGASSQWLNGTRVRFTNSVGSLPVGIIPDVDYFIRVITYAGVRYGYLFNTYAEAVGLGATRYAGLANIETDVPGTKMVAQDPQWRSVARRALSTVAPSIGDIYDILKQEGTTSIHFRDWITLLVRVIEAPSVSFISGGGTTGREILSGETVYQTSNNDKGGTVTAKYVVARKTFYRAPYTSHRNWAGNAAQGVLVLERIQGDSASNPATSQFTAGSSIFVGEPPYGTLAATVGVPGGFTDQPFRVRDNWIQFFVGDPTGNTRDLDPFDNIRGASPRDSVLWPPDNAEDTVENNDNFTLVRIGDVSVNQTYCTIFGTKNNTTGTEGDVFRFTSFGSMFTSTQAGQIFPTSRPEIGLHAYGPADSITNLYYDDFAVRFGPVGGVRSGFLLPVQR